MRENPPGALRGPEGDQYCAVMVPKSAGIELVLVF